MLRAFRAWLVRRRHEAQFEKHWQKTTGSELVRTISTLALMELNSPVLERPCTSLSPSDGKLLRNAYGVALLWIINEIVGAELTKEGCKTLVSAVVSNLLKCPHFDRALVRKMSDGAPAGLSRMWERTAPSLHAPHGILSPAAHIAHLPGSVGLPFSTPFVPDHQMTIEALHALTAFRDALRRKTPGRHK